jgi:ArsR family transcriptional regulator, virulence genes transcriptional regulator
VAVIDMRFDQLALKAGEAAQLLRAIANERRLLVLCHLISERELSAGQLVDRVGISQSALSQHLAKLRQEDLIDFRREAQTLYYRVSNDRAARVVELLRDVFCPELAEPPHADKKVRAVRTTRSPKGNHHER